MSDDSSNTHLTDLQSVSHLCVARRCRTRSDRAAAAPTRRRDTPRTAAAWGPESHPDHSPAPPTAATLQHTWRLVPEQVELQNSQHLLSSPLCDVWAVLRNVNDPDVLLDFLHFMLCLNESCKQRWTGPRSTYVGLRRRQRALTCCCRWCCSVWRGENRPWMSC